MASVLLLVSVILILLAGVCSAAAEPADDSTKIIVISLGLDNDTVSMESVDIRYGHPPNMGLQAGHYTVTIRAANGTALLTFNVWDPRDHLMMQGDVDENLTAGHTTGAVHSDSARLKLIIPYHKDIRTLELADRNSGSLLISVDIGPARERFHAKYPLDTDVLPDETRNAPLSGGFSVAGALTACALLIIFGFGIRRNS
ncbi:hypothetical protein [uncultured Methanoregula sp.]|uniref:hypothetical protein n=1 Tax=uncultured Methanoregula sp. TaxID=1005933 RepID=UPI002AAB338E|nr:hypothetical protein [uncultured Methanoregula sp.]